MYINLKALWLTLKYSFMEIGRNKFIGLIGTGIFAHKSISSLTYFLGDLTKDIFIFIEISHSLTFWLSQLIEFALYILLIYFLIEYVHKKYSSINDNIVKCFVWSFMIYFIVQIIQIAYPSIKSLLTAETNDGSFLSYYEYLGTNYSLYFVQSILYYLGEIIAIIFIYSKIKTLRVRIESSIK